MSELERAQEAVLAHEPNTPGYEEAVLALMWARIKGKTAMARLHLRAANNPLRSDTECGRQAGAVPTLYDTPTRAQLRDVYDLEPCDACFQARAQRGDPLACAVVDEEVVL